MADPRRNRPDKRNDNAAPLTGEIAVDDDTANALALFNARLVKQAEEERAAKRVERATRAKDAAAARVRELENDTTATLDQRNEAAAAYHAAVEALDRAKKGEPDPPKSDAETEAASADTSETEASETEASADTSETHASETEASADTSETAADTAAEPAADAEVDA